MLCCEARAYCVGGEVVKSTRKLPRSGAINVAGEDFTMMLPQPEFLSNLHQVISEVAIIVLTLLTFSRYIIKEIFDLIRHFRRRRR